MAAKELGLDPLCPVDDEGRFTAEAGAAFAGLAVQTEGNKAVLEVGQRSVHVGVSTAAAEPHACVLCVFVLQALTEAQALLHMQKFSHRYPFVACSAANTTRCPR